MTNVQLMELGISSILEIVYALRETDYVQNTDYWFAYYKGEFEMYDVTISGRTVQYVGPQKTPNRVVFTFVDSTVATWFILRFGGTVVSDEDVVDVK